MSIERVSSIIGKSTNKPTIVNNYQGFLVNETKTITSVNPITFTNLLGNNTYTFTINSANIYGNSLYSNTLSFNTYRKVPPSPTLEVYDISYSQRSFGCKLTFGNNHGGCIINNANWYYAFKVKDNPKFIINYTSNMLPGIYITTINSSPSWTPGSIIYSPRRYTNISFGYDEVHVLCKLDTDAGSIFSNFAVYYAESTINGVVRYYDFIS
jgi:hypothetical protein